MSRYDVLFEPVRIGPLTTKNRFFQVPHCNGMGYRDPSAQAAMRRVKAEGGWAVVCTEQVEIHPTSEIAPFIELRIWDDQDVPALARIAEAIHEGGALAGIELAHNGLNAPNLYSRETPLAPVHLPVATFSCDPVQARAMTKADIADLRRWHRNAVRRSLQAGYDLVYVCAGHALGGLPQDALYDELLAMAGTAGPVKTVRGIGDAWAPGTIAAAVWSGRRYAEEFDADLAPNDHVPFRREVTALAARP